MHDYDIFDLWLKIKKECIKDDDEPQSADDSSEIKKCKMHKFKAIIKKIALNKLQNIII